MIRFIFLTGNLTSASLKIYLDCYVIVTPTGQTKKSVLTVCFNCLIFQSHTNNTLTNFSIRIIFLVINNPVFLVTWYNVCKVRHRQKIEFVIVKRVCNLANFQTSINESKVKKILSRDNSTCFAIMSISKLIKLVDQTKSTQRSV